MISNAATLAKVLLGTGYVGIPFFFVSGLFNITMEGCQRGK